KTFEVAAVLVHTTSWLVAPTTILGVAPTVPIEALVSLSGDGGTSAPAVETRDSKTSIPRPPGATPTTAKSVPLNAADGVAPPSMTTKGVLSSTAPVGEMRTARTDGGGNRPGNAGHGASSQATRYSPAPNATAGLVCSP